MVRTIADRPIDSDDEESEEGEGEVVGLARKCLELLGDSRQSGSLPKSLTSEPKSQKSEQKSLVDG